MKSLKITFSTLLCFVMFASFSLAAQAKDFGVVNLNKVIENYSEAQKVSADLRVKESELQKFVQEENIDYLKVSLKAKEKGWTPQAIEEVIDTITKVRNNN